MTSRIILFPFFRAAGIHQWLDGTFSEAASICQPPRNWPSLRPLFVLLLILYPLTSLADHDVTAFKGHIVEEGGKRYLVLRVPLDAEGEPIFRLELETAMSGNHADGEVFVLGKLSGRRILAPQISTMTANASEGTATPSSTIIHNLQSLTQSHHSVQNVTTAPPFPPNLPAHAEPTHSANESSRGTVQSSGDTLIGVGNSKVKDLYGSWSAQIGSGSLSGSAFGISIGTDLAFRIHISLGSDGQAMMEMGSPGGSFGNGLGVSIIGVWRVARTSTGQPALEIFVIQRQGNRRLLQQVPESISFYIVHVSEGSLVLNDGAAQFALHR